MKKKGGWITYLPLIGMLGMLILFGTTLRQTSVEDILSLTPDSYLLSAIVVLGLYALKSVTVVFPLMALYVAVGAIFPTPVALLVNVAGLVICVALPYCIGRCSGRPLIARLTTRYPKVGRLTDYTSQNSLFSSYVLRVISVLPGDVVSMVLGASALPFHSYTIGSLLGLLPVMVPATLAGQNIQNPFSAAFLLPFGITIVVSAGSTFLYHRWQKRKERK